jgi:hypothetical protein
VKRGWIDLGPQFGKSRIAPIKRVWVYYGTEYNDFFPIEHDAYQQCCPEQLDQYDDEGLLFNSTCGLRPPDDEWFPTGWDESEYENLDPDDETDW